MYLGLTEGDSVVRHPQFNFTTFDNDFALIFLQHPITNISPIELNDNPHVPVSGDSLETFGWGNTDPFGANYPDVPHTVNLNYVTNEQCMTSPNLVRSVVACWYCLYYHHFAYNPIVRFRRDHRKHALCFRCWKRFLSG